MKREIINYYRKATVLGLGLLLSACGSETSSTSSIAGANVYAPFNWVTPPLNSSATVCVNPSFTVQFQGGITGLNSFNASSQTFYLNQVGSSAAPVKLTRGFPNAASGQYTFYLDGGVSLVPRTSYVISLYNDPNLSTTAAIPNSNQFTTGTNTCANTGDFRLLQIYNTGVKGFNPDGMSTFGQANANGVANYNLGAFVRSYTQVLAGLALNIIFNIVHRSPTDSAPINFEYNRPIKQLALGDTVAQLFQVTTGQSTSLTGQFVAIAGTHVTPYTGNSSVFSLSLPNNASLYPAGSYVVVVQPLPSESGFMAPGYISNPFPIY